MKTKLTQEICQRMKSHLSPEQSKLLENTLMQVFASFNLPNETPSDLSRNQRENSRLIELFIASKKIEGCSENTLKYYSNTLTKILNEISKTIYNMM